MKREINEGRIKEDGLKKLWKEGRIRRQLHYGLGFMDGLANECKDEGKNEEWRGDLRSLGDE